MSKPILVITNKNDTHVDFVGLEIRKLGGDIIRINTEDIAENSSFSCYFDNSRPGWSSSWKILDSSILFKEEDFDTVWYRKPKPVEYSNNTMEDHAQLFIKEEYDYFLRSFYSFNSHKRWFNPYWEMRRASQKLPNLKLAESLGLKTPKTIITNNPDAARDFGRQCNWNLLVKTFFFSSFVFNEDEAWHCFAKKIDHDDFENFAKTIELSPNFLQEYIEKSLELRVTVMGETIFTVAIHSQEFEKTQEDCRAGNMYDLKHTVYNLPQEVCEKLLAFNRFYSLPFSTFDIILTPAEDYVFLECNPNGQWYWIESMTELPMASTMARLLLDI